MAFRGFRSIRTAVVILVLFTGIVGYQNCGSPSGSTSAAVTAAAAPSTMGGCVASTCPTTADALQLDIANPDPLTIQYAREQKINLGGYCDPSGFPAVHFYYIVTDSTGRTVITSPKTGATCNGLGRFQLSVDLSQSFDPTVGHQLTVIMAGVDATGKEFENPTGLNRKVRTINSL